jgi:outer membrane protein TolC
VNRLGIRRSEQDVLELVMSVASQVALTYHDVIAARENVKVQRKAVETSERRLAEQKKRVEVGALAPLDEKQSEAEVFRTRADLLRSEGAYGDALTRLRNLVSDDLSGLDEIVLDPTLALTALPVAFDKKDSWHKALTQRPDVLRAGVLLEQQKIRARFARNQLYPQLDLTGSYGLIGVAGQSPNPLNPAGTPGHLGDALDNLAGRNSPSHSAGIVLSFPLTRRNAREANKQARLEQERLLLDYKRTEQSAMRDIDISIRAAKTQLERVSATRKQREFAAQAVDAEEKKLANGKSTSFQVLELQRQLTQAESDEIGALSEYNKELYRLSQAEGDLLNKMGILLDMR